MAAPALLRADSELPVRTLVAIQAADAIACAIPLPALKDALDHVGCPPVLQRAIPVIKAASVAGLLAGRRDARVGRLTTSALLAYFACALGAHARVRDPAPNYVAALGMAGLTLAARRAFR